MEENPVDKLFELVESRGGALYGGERVTQLQHALQCAALAEADGADAALICAALLHDIGHFVHELSDEPAANDIDDRHELRGREWLARWFDEPVTEPVRLHVNAKRYLTATDPSYLSTLSLASVRSLERQGGPFSEALARGFLALPYATDAIRLRRWDDAAKRPGKTTPALAHFVPYLELSLRR